jgi:hypothetical protein
MGEPVTLKSGKLGKRSAGVHSAWPTPFPWGLA